MRRGEGGQSRAEQSARRRVFERERESERALSGALCCGDGVCVTRSSVTPPTLPTPGLLIIIIIIICPGAVTPSGTHSLTLLPLPPPRLREPPGVHMKPLLRSR